MNISTLFKIIIEKEASDLYLRTKAFPRARIHGKVEVIYPEPLSKKEMLENDLFLEDFYDDWEDYRDGMRDKFGDFKKIKSVHPRYKRHNPELYKKRLERNRKQRKLLSIRKARKNMLNL